MGGKRLLYFARNINIIVLSYICTFGNTSLMAYEKLIEKNYTSAHKACTEKEINK